MGLRQRKEVYKRQVVENERQCGTLGLLARGGSLSGNQGKEAGHAPAFVLARNFNAATYVDGEFMRVPLHRQPYAP